MAQENTSQRENLQLDRDRTPGSQGSDSTPARGGNPAAQGGGDGKQEGSGPQGGESRQDGGNPQGGGRQGEVPEAGRPGSGPQGDRDRTPELDVEDEETNERGTGVGSAGRSDVDRGRQGSTQG